MTPYLILGLSSLLCGFKFVGVALPPKPCTVAYRVESWVSKGYCDCGTAWQTNIFLYSKWLQDKSKNAEKHRKQMKQEQELDKWQRLK